MQRETLRLSRYTICSTPRADGSYVLLHGLTGAVDVVNSSVVSALMRFGELLGAKGKILTVASPVTADDASLSDTEVRLLVDRGYLTSTPDQAEIEMAAAAAEVLHDKAATNPAFLIIPTLDCNYRCTYCFERPVQNSLNRNCESTTQGLLGIVAAHRDSNVVMSEKHVEAIYSSIPKLQAHHSDDRTELQLVLYGGEPLDARNAPIVYEIVERGSALGHRFAAITNGHDIPTFDSLFGPHAIQQVQVSIDGPKSVHDRRRVHLGRESSFDRVVAGIDLLESSGCTLVQIRVHIDPVNIENFEELLCFFEGRGWLNHPNILIYANTVYDSGEARLNLDEIEQRLSTLVASYDNVLLNAPAINLRAKLLPALLQGLQVPAQGNYCAANTGQYLFSPDGHLYSCWESVGKRDSRVGTYYDANRGNQLRLDRDATSEWFTRHAGAIDECRVCPMALCCGGGCAQFAKYNTGTQLSPYCDSFDKIFRKALAQMVDVHAARVRENREHSSRPFGLVRANYG